MSQEFHKTFTMATLKDPGEKYDFTFGKVLSTAALSREDLLLFPNDIIICQVVFPGVFDQVAILFSLLS
jgi:hypothetical protein